MVDVRLLLCSLFAFTTANTTDLSEICNQVVPTWHPTQGRPIITLSGPEAQAISIRWAWHAVTSGLSCVQAVDVERQTFGVGRTSFSSWSSLIGCGQILSGTKTRMGECVVQLRSDDCDKLFRIRIVLHNVFNQEHVMTPSLAQDISVQCRTVSGVSPEPGMRDGEMRSNKIFIVRRVNHRQQEWSDSENDNDKKNDNNDTKMKSKDKERESENEKGEKTVVKTEELESSTTSPITMSPVETVLGSSPKSSSSPTSRLTHKSGPAPTVVLLPGRFSDQVADEQYEVRHNLKNFTENTNKLTSCGKYSVRTLATDCDRKHLQIGLTVCLSGAAGSLPLASSLRFKWMLQPSCHGHLAFSERLRQCNCRPHNTFIVVT